MILCGQTGIHVKGWGKINSMKTAYPNRGKARETILATAGRLFYQQGFQAVGINRIIEEAGVAKNTFFRHFPSKDELICVYLQQVHQQFMGWMRKTVAGLPPEAALRAVMESVQKTATSEHCKGCIFIHSAAEFPDLGSPAHQLACAHKQELRDFLEELAATASLQQPQALAEQLLLVIDGAWAAARMFGPDNQARQLTQLTELLLAGHARLEI